MESLNLLLDLALRAVIPALLAALAVRLPALRSPAARHAIWTAVLLTMLLQLPLHPILPPLPVRILQPLPQQTAAPVSLPLLPLPNPQPVPASHWPPSPDFIAFSLYAAVVVFFLVKLAAGHYFTRRILRNATPASIPSPAVPVFASDSISVPMTTGWRSPLILLPSSWTSWDHAKLQAVLAHEYAHIQRRDWPIALAARLNRAIFWFHPLAWWLERSLASLAEQACDDSAISQTGDRHHYAQTLIEIAQDCHSASGRFLTAMAHSPSVRSRIDSILDESRPLASPPRPRFFLALSACAAAVLYFAATVQLAPAQSPQSNANTPYLKWLNEDVVYIVTAAEKEAFLRLPTDAEREHFIEQFWLRRDPTPGTPRNEFKEELYRRISYANQRFASTIPGWKTDRGRVYITQGPPDEIESHPSGGSRQPIINFLGPVPGLGDDPVPYDLWLYHKPSLRLGFLDKNRDGIYTIIAGEVPPGIVTTVEPQYTDAARSARIQGPVELAVTVDVDGLPHDIRVTKSLDPGLDQKAIECLRSWRFRPALRNGVPVPQSMNVYLSFRLPQ